MEFDSCLAKWRADLAVIKLKVAESLVGVAVALQFLLCHGCEKRHDGWTADNEEGWRLG